MNRINSNNKRGPQKVYNDDFKELIINNIDVLKALKIVSGFEDTNNAVDTLKDVIKFLDGFEDKDVLKEILENSKPVELTEHLGDGEELPLASSYTFYGLPVSHYRFTDISDNRCLLVFCVGHDSENVTGHIYLVYVFKNEPGGKCIFVTSYNDIPDDPRYAPADIRALFGNVLPGEELENGVVKQGLMTLEDKQKLDNAATKTEVNAKYTKPSAGIPKTDLNSAVQTSLNKADSALQNHQDISHLATKEEVENNEKVTAAALVDLESKKANKEDISKKQDIITDLATIRSGAAKGTTSLQTSQRGVANGVASLDSTGKVPSSQLPSYVDDVLEYSTLSNLPSPGETGKIYVTTNDNKSYRWTGTTYIEISKSIIIGETTGTAFDGGKGKELLDDLSVIKQTIEDNEKITSASLVELNKRISNIEQQLNS